MQPTLFGGDLLLSDRLTAAAPRPIKIYSQHITSLPQPLLLANLICSTADLLTRVLAGTTGQRTDFSPFNTRLTE